MKVEVTLKKDISFVKAGTGIPLKKDGFLTFLGMEILPSEHPDWFEVKEIYTPEDVKVDSYWKNAGGIIFRINKITDGASVIFNRFPTEKHEADCLTPEEWLHPEDRPATTPEIESALIKEAEMRGYKEGVTIRNVRGKVLIIPNYQLIYSPETDSIYLQNIYGFRFGEIYCKGIWAEIIEPEKEEKKKSPIPEMVKMLNELESFISKKQDGIPAMQSKIAQVKNYLKNLEA